MIKVKTILLKFSAPLQAYGTSSHFETRHTDYYPSKSAVIGMIAGSLGYRRDETEKIKRLKDINFAVRVDQEGSLLRDYHIATKYGTKPEVFVTNRYYLQDAIFVVGISSEDDGLMAEIEEGLKYPYFQNFLGKRSLPPTADYILGVSDKELIEALSETKWQASDWYKKKNKNTTKISIYADSHLVNSKINTLRKDDFQSFSNLSREHAFRYEGKIEIEVR